MYNQKDRIDNNWLAIPLIVDFRTFRFNMTTFDYCINKGYDLHYPPWTWKKAFEYAKLLTECTGKPGIRLINAKSEDTKFFVVLCQSLGIPFLVEDINLSIKKSGFRNDEYIKKLEIVKELFENHYIESWLDEDEIKQWIKAPYPISIEDQPIFSPKAEQVNSKKFSINGMLFDILTSYYMPGGSSFLGGAGIVITKHSKYHDEIFKYIEILIDKKYPYFTYLNISMTPFEKVHGSKCENNEKEESKMDQCNSVIGTPGTFPYYFIYNGKIHIVYLNHVVSNGLVNRITINMDSEAFLNDSELRKVFKSDTYNCNYSASYDHNRIAYYDQFRLEFPLSHNETIILKSMRDYHGGFNEKQTNKKVCSIYDEYLKDAKPIQFPYNVL
ncbi:hypothetical protein LY90DRAFT_515334 [Neocallimastix californiae]|uniref:Uncharacterized protein n=1 Tax=Neocallimastix californiae TaxID=1754190 RepID=A0A1Y2ALH0_9FUNG|nr:hypothetical protein LY90DRAFT_515334 [Neocallimastix californiae]|eukprot:ORY22805.1 hypothetical protein LY90DRAFT_515334 [Neocallimastix californiae]